MTSAEFLATQFPGLASWIRATAAAGVSSRVHERDGVTAQVSPSAPDASLFNSVTYRDIGALRAALPELESVYADAGVRAWTVWAHESDVEASALLREGGHVLDSSPEGMGCALDELTRSGVSQRVALLHYAPIEATLVGEHEQVWPFLGNYLLAEAVDRLGADLVLHGHAHRGYPEGATARGVPVRNVAYPVINQPYLVIELNGEPLE